MELQTQQAPEGHFQKLYPLLKVDEVNHTISGLLADESVDKSSESMDYVKSKPHFEKWSGEIAKATGGRSLGNLREMHSLNAVGHFTNIEYDDEGKKVLGTAQVDDPLCWKKCVSGTLNGFSIGGSYAGGLTNEKVDGKPVKRYVASVSEISAVDNPCNSNAYFTYVKVDGTTELRKFHNPKEEEVENMTREELEELVQKTVSSILVKKEEVEKPKELQKEDVCPKCKEPVVDGKCKCEKVAETCATCGLKKEEGHKCAVVKREKPSQEAMARTVTEILGKTLEKVYNLTPEKVDNVFEGVLEMEKGGSGSGNFGHSGRPGSMGGSSGGSSSVGDGEGASRSRSDYHHVLSSNGWKGDPDRHYTHSLFPGHQVSLHYGNVGDASNKTHYLTLMYARHQDGNKALTHFSSAQDLHQHLARIHAEANKAAVPEFEKVENTQPLKKGMNSISRLAQLLLDVAWLKWQTQQESEAEGDDSPLVASLQEDVSNLAETLLEMAGEETKELVENLAAGKAPYESSISGGLNSCCSAPTPFYRASAPPDDGLFKVMEPEVESFFKVSDEDSTDGFEGYEETSPCPCQCENCKEGNCDECDNEQCCYIDCDECPMQKAVQGEGFSIGRVAVPLQL